MNEREKRRIYSNDDLHVVSHPNLCSVTQTSFCVYVFLLFFVHASVIQTMLGLLLDLMLAPDQQGLSRLYCDRFPLPSLGSQAANIPALLHSHLNHQANATLLPYLLEFLTLSGFGSGMFRLLRLLCQRFFSSSLYSALTRLGGGRFGHVYLSTSLLCGEKVFSDLSLFCSIFFCFSLFWPA